MRAISVVSVISLVVIGAFADDGDVIDLSENTVDSFKAAVGQHDAMLIEFCKPKFCNS